MATIRNKNKLILSTFKNTILFINDKPPGAGLLFPVSKQKNKKPGKSGGLLSLNRYLNTCSRYCTALSPKGLGHYDPQDCIDSHPFNLSPQERAVPIPHIYQRLRHLPSILLQHPLGQSVQRLYLRVSSSHQMQRPPSLLQHLSPRPCRLLKSSTSKSSTNIFLRLQPHRLPAFPLYY